MRFEENRDTYIWLYDELKKINKELKIKTPDSEKEADPITDEIFKIDYFSSCLSQSQIEDYNSIEKIHKLIVDKCRERKEENE